MHMQYVYSKVDCLCIAILIFQVTVFPSETVITSLGKKNFTFNCLRSRTDDVFQDIAWLLNGSTPDDLRVESIITVFQPIGRIIGIVIFTSMHLEYNHTTIQCVGSSQSGWTHPSQGVLLLLQGK